MVDALGNIHPLKQIRYIYLNVIFVIMYNSFNVVVPKQILI